MGKGVFAHNCFAARYHQPAHATHQTRRFHDLARIYFRVKVFEIVGPRLDCHHDLFNRGVAGAFSDAVDSSLDLARTRLDSRRSNLRSPFPDHCDNAR